jgi:rhodanese-related sulfurtransferase
MLHPPVTPQEAPVTVAHLLAAARSRFDRLTPAAAHAAMCRGAVLVDVRSDTQRASDGTVPGAYFVSRNVLEWRLDPACPHCDRFLARPETRQILLCNEGYQSSLVAATLQGFGLMHATDVIGGFQAWRAAGLPVLAPPGRDDAAIAGAVSVAGLARVPTTPEP